MASSSPLVVDVEFDKRQRQELHEFLKETPDAIQRAESLALNKAASKGKTRVKRELSKHLNLSQKKIAKRITFRKSSKNNLQASVNLRSEPIPLVEYMGTPSRVRRMYDRQRRQSNFSGKKRKKLELTVRRGRKEKPKFSFLAEVHAGTGKKMHVFKRRRASLSAAGVDSKGRPKYNRLPIRVLRGPTIAGSFKGATGVAQKSLQGIEHDLFEATDQVIRLILEANTPVARRILGIR